jgi:hypothetical protein
MRDYFKKKLDAIEGKKEGSENAKRFTAEILCKIWTFESILGVILSMYWICRNGFGIAVYQTRQSFFHQEIDPIFHLILTKGLAV